MRKAPSGVRPTARATTQQRQHPDTRRGAPCAGRRYVTRARHRRGALRFRPALVHRRWHRGRADWLAHACPWPRDGGSGRDRPPPQGGPSPSTPPSLAATAPCASRGTAIFARRCVSPDTATTTAGYVTTWCGRPNCCTHCLAPSRRPRVRCLNRWESPSTRSTSVACARASVAVIGCGPIGLLLAQLALVAGAARVVAVDPLEHRRHAALQYGAALALSPEDMSDHQAIAGAVGPLASTSHSRSRA